MVARWHGGRGCRCPGGAQCQFPGTCCQRNGPEGRERAVRRKDAHGRFTRCLGCVGEAVSMRPARRRPAAVDVAAARPKANLEQSFLLYAFDVRYTAPLPLPSSCAHHAHAIAYDGIYGSAAPAPATNARWSTHMLFLVVCVPPKAKAKAKAAVQPPVAAPPLAVAPPPHDVLVMALAAATDRIVAALAENTAAIRQHSAAVGTARDDGGEAAAASVRREAALLPVAAFGAAICPTPACPPALQRLKDAADTLLGGPEPWSAHAVLRAAGAGTSGPAWARLRVVLAVYHPAVAQRVGAAESRLTS